MDHTRASLAKQKLPNYLWQEGVAFMTYLRNRLPTRATGKMPYELFYGKKAKLQHLEEFGAEIWVLDQSGKTRKLDPRANKYRFTGFTENSRAYRYWKSSTRQVLTSRNVVFVQTGEEKEVQDEDEEEDVLMVPGGVSSTVTPVAVTSPSAPATAPLKTLQPPKRPSTLPAKTKEEPSTPPKASTSTPQPPPPKKPTLSTSSRQKVRRDYARMHSTRLDTPDNDQMFEPTIPGGFNQPRIEETPSEDDIDSSLLGIQEEWAEMAYAATSHPHDEDHPSYKESLTLWDAPDWETARDAEFTVLTSMGTFELCDLPTGFKPLKPLWVQAAKRDQDGNITRKKARLVVRGYAQREGIDYGDVFAHVLRSDSLHTLFGLAAIYDWDIHGLDVVSAFLNGKVEEELYMRQIPGYEDGTNRVLRLIGSLYGLKQAPHIWNNLFSSKFLSLSYTRLPSEPSIYTRHKGDQLSILAVYVDDIAVFTSKGHVTGAKKELMELFEMRDLGELNNFLGYRITRNRNDMTITISQDKYIKSIIERAGLSQANENKIPLPAGTQYERYTGPRIDYPYATRIGELLYAALGTYPEIAFAVQHLSQFTSNPGPEHIAGVKHVYRYLKGVGQKGITYDGKGAVPEFQCFTDADWGQNILDRKSISGHVFLLAGGATSWTSKKQATVALSTLEGEYVALSLAIRHSLWLRQFFTDLSITTNKPFTIHTDSVSAIALSKDAQFHARSKHIDIHHHFIRDVVDKGLVEIRFTPGKKNVADIFTKALPFPRYNGLRATLKGDRLVQEVQSNGYDNSDDDRSCSVLAKTSE